METTETKDLEYLKKLTTIHFSTLKPANDKSKTYTAQIKVVNYLELGCIITDLLKSCILALDNDAHNFSKPDKSAVINVSLILETVLNMFPLDEFEFLDYVGEVVGE